jgi:hypothetical protein
LIETSTLQLCLVSSSSATWRGGLITHKTDFFLAYHGAHAAQCNFECTGIRRVENDQKTTGAFLFVPVQGFAFTVNLQTQIQQRLSHLSNEYRNTPDYPMMVGNADYGRQNYPPFGPAVVNILRALEYTVTVGLA